MKSKKFPITSRRICVAEPSAYVSEGECVANAVLIVTAVNAHAALVAACEAAESILRAYIPAENFDGHAARTLESVRAALALARPTTPTEKGR